jgi:hypothetical protein
VIRNNADAAAPAVNVSVQLQPLQNHQARHVVKDMRTTKLQGGMQQRGVVVREHEIVDQQIRCVSSQYTNRSDRKHAGTIALNTQRNA